MRFQRILGFIVSTALLIFANSAVDAQVIQPPDVNCVNNDNLNNDVILTWSVPPNNCGGTFNGYLIFASDNSNGPYNLLATISDPAATSFTHAGALNTSADWYYYMESDYDCPGFVPGRSDTVKNVAPSVPEILSVSVNTDGTVTIHWAPSPEPQTHYNVIYYYTGVNNTELVDTAFGVAVDSFVDVIRQFNAELEPISYTIAAFDSCDNNNGFNQIPHRTIFLSTEVFNCDGEIGMTWTPYINWPDGGVFDYQILANVNNSGDSLIASVDSSVREYFFTNFNDGDSVCLTVRARARFDTFIVSRSNQVCLRPEIEQPPSDLYMTRISVTLNNQVEVDWMSDPNAELIAYGVENALNNNFSPFIELDRLNIPFGPDSFEFFIDSASSPEKESNFYRIQAYNNCNQAYTSSTGSTIYLETELDNFFINHLNWTAFDLEYGEVTAYNVYRDNGSGFTFLGSTGPAELEFVDDITDFREGDGLFCYRIEALYDVALPNGYEDQLNSFSNVACQSQRALFYFPPVFLPGTGQEDLKPAILFGAEGDYNMQIYNRWGEKIFETDNPDEGWDGTKKGKEAPPGGYPYLVSFFSTDGVKLEKKGIVLLIR